VTIPRTHDETSGPPRRHAATYALAFLGYSIVTLLVLREIVAHLSTRLPHDLGDPLLSTAILWWNTHALPLTERWWNGFGFWPATGMLAFSDHRLGESLIASPLHWAGAGPIAAHNMTLLAMFPLCALAAHWFAFTLTRRHDAAVLAGLAYGFNPYRAGHLEHLELLAAFGLPAALAALHLYMTERRTPWLVVFAGALVLQGLFCSYYVVYLVIVVALWTLWFARRDNIRLIIGVAAAGALAAVPLAPIAWSLLRIHRHYGFARSFNDIITLSADVTSFVTASPLDALWRWTSTLNDTERQLFPGAILMALVVAGLAGSIRRARPAAAAARASIVMAVLAVLVAAIVAAAAAGFGFSIHSPYKPLSIAFVFLAVALLCSSPARLAYRERSPFAFYVLLALFLAVCCLGPKPRVLGYQFLYEPPYSWFMRIRAVGEGMRVPARFAMPMILALSAAAAIAFDRLAPRRQSRLVLASMLAAGIVAEGWVTGLDMLALPAGWPAEITAKNAAAFLEMPLGETNLDTSAMYQALQHNLPALNGYSGYEPGYYSAARVALLDHDDSVLDAFASRGPLLVAVNRQANWSIETLAWFKGRGMQPFHEDPLRTWFVLGAPVLPKPDCAGPALPIAAARDRNGPVDLRPLLDGDRHTNWTAGPKQRAGDEIVFDLGSATIPCSLRLSIGSTVATYPRRMNVEVSEDGQTWQPVFDGPTGGQAILSQIDNPLDGRIEIRLNKAPTRYVRCRLTADYATLPWVISDVAISADPSTTVPAAATP
jgi:F5/8 type C domain-containing protein